ncbi:hypothetical protein [Nonomuraea fuscirosea]|uniref:hypothetical protein n=1 Tax=Nonomuraea fuscirosea TaxID=1291556 RepID=UPI00341FAC7B
MVLPNRPSGGSYAGQVVLPASSVTRAPADTSHAEAATLPPHRPMRNSSGPWARNIVVPRGDTVAARVREVVPEGVDGLADGALIGAPGTAAVRGGGGIRGRLVLEF